MALFVGVCIIRGLLFGLYIKAPDSWKLLFGLLSSVKESRSEPSKGGPYLESPALGREDSSGLHGGLGGSFFRKPTLVGLFLRFDLR